jgi:hypothetical protein
MLDRCGGSAVQLCGCWLDLDERDTRVGLRAWDGVGPAS